MLKKRIVGKLFDKLLWFVVYILPLIFIMYYSFNMNTQVEVNGDITTTTILNSDIYIDVFNTFNVNSDSIVSQSISDFAQYLNTTIFDVGSFANLYLTYFIYVNIIHVIVDFLLLLPRLAHKYIDRWCSQ